MRELIAIAYDDEAKARRVRAELLGMEKAHLVDLEGAVVVTRNEEGNVNLDQMHRLTEQGALSGTWWGLLIGILLSLPIAGPGAIAVPFFSGALGAGLGALTDSVADVGIDDAFMKSVSEHLVPGSSALFILVRKITPDRVLSAIAPYGGKMLVTSLNREAEATLDAMLQQPQPTSETTTTPGL